MHQEAIEINNQAPRKLASPEENKETFTLGKSDEIQLIEAAGSLRKPRSAKKVESPLIQKGQVSGGEEPKMPVSHMNVNIMGADQDLEPRKEQEKETKKKPKVSKSELNLFQ